MTEEGPGGPSPSDVSVTVEELEAQLGLPLRARLSADTWRAAAVLGRLRTLVNDRHRSSDRDRGQGKNLLNDLQGALGELIGLELLQRRGLAAPVSGLIDL